MQTMLKNPKIDFVSHLYELLIYAASNLQSAVLLALRLTWGWQLAESGYGHLTHIENTVKAFTEWGIPFPTANVYMSGTMELVGGTLLILGLATRLISIPLIFNFIVAYAVDARDQLHEWLTGKHLDGSWGGRLDGYDNVINYAAFTILILAVVMLAFGPGKASIDYLLQCKVFRKSDNHPESVAIQSSPHLL
jgi:putative oxidoreductase